MAMTRKEFIGRRATWHSSRPGRASTWTRRWARRWRMARTFMRRLSAAWC